MHLQAGLAAGAAAPALCALRQHTRVPCSGAATLWQGADPPRAQWRQGRVGMQDCMGLWGLLSEWLLLRHHPHLRTGPASGASPPLGCCPAPAAEQTSREEEALREPESSWHSRQVCCKQHKLLAGLQT